MLRSAQTTCIAGDGPQADKAMGRADTTSRAHSSRNHAKAVPVPIDAPVSTLLKAPRLCPLEHIWETAVKNITKASACPAAHVDME